MCFWSLTEITEHHHPKEKDDEADWSSDSPVAPVSNTDGASVSPDDIHNALIICTDSEQAKKPLKCPHCCKRFKLMKFLIRHQHWHTGARPYLCPLCGKSFAHTNALKNHEQTHTQERTHRCLVCGKTFGFARYLRVHKLIHGNKTFLCSTCGKGFTSRARLKVIPQHVFNHVVLLRIRKGCNSLVIGITIHMNCLHGL